MKQSHFLKIGYNVNSSKCAFVRVRHEFLQNHMWRLGAHRGSQRQLVLMRTVPFCMTQTKLRHMAGSSPMFSKTMHKLWCGCFWTTAAKTKDMCNDKFQTWMRHASSAWWGRKCSLTGTLTFLYVENEASQLRFVAFIEDSDPLFCGPFIAEW